MTISERQQRILALLEENGFMSVEQLSKLTYTSPSSIRRDLASLQNLSLIRRTHGGASLFLELNLAVPFHRRMEKNTVEKRKIAQSASVLLNDGQVVMLDGSSTASFMVPHIAKFKDMILFTNNMQTAITSISCGIMTHCIGGASVKQSVVLAGEQAYSIVDKLTPDILFFSSKSLDTDGYIYDPVPEETHLRELALKNAKCNVFLCDSTKFGQKSLYRLTSVNDVDVCVFDKPYPELSSKCRIIC